MINSYYYSYIDKNIREIEKLIKNEKYIDNFNLCILSNKGEVVLKKTIISGQKKKLDWDINPSIITEKIRVYEKKFTCKSGNIYAQFRLDFFEDSDIIARMYINTIEKNRHLIISLLNNNYFIVFSHKNLIILNKYINDFQRLFYIIDTFSELMSIKDRFMPNHMSNVAYISLIISKELNFDQNAIKELILAALMHDVGKLSISDEILNKPGQLTEFEYDYVKQHSIIGESIVDSILSDKVTFGNTPKIIRHHHEHYDGKGYPDKLTKSDIPLGSRIICVADAIDSMKSTHAYKKKSTNIEIVKELRKLSGKQFDPIISTIAIAFLLEKNPLDLKKDLFDINYIPKISIVLFLENVRNRFDFIGNMIVLGSESKIIVHNSKHQATLKKIENCDINKGKIFFILMEKSYEFEVKINKIANNEIMVSELKRIVDDKYFTISWDVPVELKSEREIITGQSIQISGGSIVISSEVENKSSFISDYNTRIFIDFTLETNSTVEIFEIELRLEHYYVSSSICYAKYKYVNILSDKRDKLMKVLFRKQMEKRIIGRKNLF